MTDSNTATAKTRKAKTDRRSAIETSGTNGDPGVGGLLADPQAAVSTKVGRHSKVPVGPLSPDPEPPKAHGDWAPNRAWRGT
jgi:hypothetical protein